MSRIPRVHQIHDNLTYAPPVQTTRLSLIRNLAGDEPEAWEEIDRIYRPMILHWLRRYSLSTGDAEDLTQDVMTVIIREISQFEHNGRLGAFRNWLHTTTANLVRNHLRKRNLPRGTGSDDVFEMLAQLEDPHSLLAEEFDREHQRHVVRGLMSRIARMFEPITLDMFRLHVLQGLTPAETAVRLDVPVASVHTAKSRVLRKLRQYAADCFDEI